MNVYDFDGTIYNGDSTIDFYLFCLKRNKKLLRALPVQLKGFFLFGIKRIKKMLFKEYFYKFLCEMNDTENLLEEFWSVNSKKIKMWYLDQKKNDDVIISASPEFLLKPICEKLGNIYLIASRVNMQTGKYMGENCRGQEKVNRFVSLFKAEEIDEFYSDNKSDYPMAKLAKKSYYVKKNILKEWKT